MGLTCKKHLGKMKSLMTKLDNAELRRKERLNESKSQRKRTN